MNKEQVESIVSKLEKMGAEGTVIGSIWEEWNEQESGGNQNRLNRAIVWALWLMSEK